MAQYLWGPKASMNSYFGVDVSTISVPGPFGLDYSSLHHIPQLEY